MVISLRNNNATFTSKKKSSKKMTLNGKESIEVESNCDEDLSQSDEPAITSSKEGISLGRRESMSSSSKEGISLERRESMSSSSKEVISLGDRESISSSSKEFISLGDRESISSSSKEVISLGDREFISSKEVISLGDRESMSSSSKEVMSWEGVCKSENGDFFQCWVRLEEEEGEQLLEAAQFSAHRHELAGFTCLQCEEVGLVPFPSILSHFNQTHRQDGYPYLRYRYRTVPTKHSLR